MTDRPGIDPSRFQVSTPSLGVKVWIEDNKLRVGAATEGGRGLPVSVLCVPVAKEGDHWEVATPLANAQGRGPAAPIDHVEAYLPPADMLRPVAMEFTREKWDAFGSREILLLVTTQAPDITEDEPVDPIGPDSSASFQQDMVRDYVRQCTDQQIERGLVVAPADWSAVASRDVQSDRRWPFTFAVASCQYPGGLLDSTSRSAPAQAWLAGPADASLLRLRKRIDAGRDAPSMLLLVGDQVYADATAGLFDPRRRDDRYRIAYQGLRGGRGAQAVFGRLPVQVLIDDHEIRDNWEDDDVDDLKDGVEAFIGDQWPSVDVALTRAPRLQRTYHYGGVPFFFANTRTKRFCRTAQTYDQPVTDRNGSILGKLAAWTELEKWLGETDKQVGPRFIVTPSMVLPRPRELKANPDTALHCDSWNGYPASLARLLNLAYEHGRKAPKAPIVFLSGDEHISNRTRIELKRGTGRVVIWSIHSSALYAPYPFANSAPEDFLNDETITDANASWCARDFSCQVTTLYPGDMTDGFALLTLRNAYTLEVLFDRAGGRDPQNSFTIDFR